MDFHVMTLFPDMIMDGLNTSITGRAIKAGVMSVKAYDIREYSNDKHLKVDDYPYGGGAGMVMRAAPVCDCYEDIVRNIGKRPRVVYMTPQGYTFTQSIMGKLFQRCFYQVIMLILKSGDMKSHWRELRNTDQICMKHIQRNILMNSGKLGRGHYQL